MSADIVVLGAGITGALISDALIQDGYQTMLLDKGDVACGSTAATTAMLQYEIDVPLYRLSRKIGLEGAVTCYRAGIDAIRDLEQLIQTRNIDCGFHKKSSLYVAHTASAASWLHQEFEIRRQHRLGVRWLSPATLKKQYQLNSFGGILSKTGAGLDAYQLAHELIHQNTRKGLQVYDQTAIEKVHHQERAVIIDLKNGCQIRARRIVYCTGYETVKMFREPIATLHSTFACVSEAGIKVPAKLRDLLVWNTRNPYLYLRTTDDGRLLVGGADSQYTTAAYLQKNKERKSRELTRQLAELLPGVDFVEDISWAGIFGSTKDGLPYIGAHPDFKNAFFVLGFGGNGISFSIQARSIITRLLRRGNNGTAPYYQFNR